MYADDVVFYVSSKNVGLAEKLLQEDVSSVYDWFSKSGLCINTEKTQVITFTTSKYVVPLKITMGGHRLKVCSQFENFGVVLDSGINLTKIVISASIGLYMFDKTRNQMSKRVAIGVYKQTIAPVLEYCGMLYNSATENNQKRLQRV